MEAVTAAKALRFIYTMIHMDVFTWEDKFNAIFAKYNEEIKPCLKKYNMSFEYYDPDASYEDDVKALASALHGIRDRIEAFANLETMY
jgi:hypothetical protein